MRESAMHAVARACVCLVSARLERAVAVVVAECAVDLVPERVRSVEARSRSVDLKALDELFGRDDDVFAARTRAVSVSFLL